uniref:Uncharacterized protein n=1 Tax=Strix occidentalis caurina TaxID=311401 RepID=A0A8D0FL28_STROC
MSCFIPVSPGKAAESSQGSRRCPWVKGQRGPEAPAQGSSQGMLWAVCPSLSSPPARTARSGMAVSRGVWSQSHRVIRPEHGCPQAQLPAWPEPSLSLVWVYPVSLI